MSHDQNIWSILILSGGYQTLVPSTVAKMTIQIYHDHSEISLDEFNKLKDMVTESTF